MCCRPRTRVSLSVIPKLSPNQDCETFIFKMDPISLAIGVSVGSRHTPQASSQPRPVCPLAPGKSKASLNNPPPHPLQPTVAPIGEALQNLPCRKDTAITKGSERLPACIVFSAFSSFLLMTSPWTAPHAGSQHDLPWRPLYPWVLFQTTASPGKPSQSWMQSL